MSSWMAFVHTGNPNIAVARLLSAILQKGVLFRKEEVASSHAFAGPWFRARLSEENPTGASQQYLESQEILPQVRRSPTTNWWLGAEQRPLWKEIWAPELS